MKTLEGKSAAQLRDEKRDFYEAVARWCDATPKRPYGGISRVELVALLKILDAYLVDVAVEARHIAKRNAA